MIRMPPVSATRNRVEAKKIEWTGCGRYRRERCPRSQTGTTSS